MASAAGGLDPFAPAEVHVCAGVVPRVRGLDADAVDFLLLGGYNCNSFGSRRLGRRTSELRHRPTRPSDRVNEQARHRRRTRFPRRRRGDLLGPHRSGSSTWGRDGRDHEHRDRDAGLGEPRHLQNDIVTGGGRSPRRRPPLGRSASRIPSAGSPEVRSPRAGSAAAALGDQRAASPCRSAGLGQRPAIHDDIVSRTGTVAATVGDRHGRRDRRDVHRGRIAPRGETPRSPTCSSLGSDSAVFADASDQRILHRRHRRCRRHPALPSSKAVGTRPSSSSAEHRASTIRAADRRVLSRTAPTAGRLYGSSVGDVGDLPVSSGKPVDRRLLEIHAGEATGALARRPSASSSSRPHSP